MVKTKTTKPKKARKKRPVTDPCHSYPTWSAARYRAFIRSAMRKAWQKWPPRFDALRRVRRPYHGSNARQKWEFQCAHCSGWFMGKEVSVDHITPWGKIDDLSLHEAWARLLVPVDALQILCKGCHDHKTDNE